MLLLTALFTSSCYWQPVPIDTPLTRPIGNASTFAEALIESLSTYNFTIHVPPTNLTHPATSAVTHTNVTVQRADANSNSNANATETRSIELPKVIRLVDRCWCSLANPGGIFAPTDPSEWERRSVERAARRLKKNYDKKHGLAIDANSSVVDEPKSPTADGNDNNEDGVDDFTFKVQLEFSEPQDLSTKDSLLDRIRQLSHLISLSPTVLPIYQRAYGKPSCASPTSTSIDATLPSASASSSLSPTPTPGLPLLRPYYDLRPYGLDMTIDFSWHRS